MSSADLERGAPHWCLAAIRAPLPGGGWVSTQGPWTNAELAELRGQFADLDRQVRALEQLEPGESDADLERLAVLFLTGMTAAEMLIRGPAGRQLEQPYLTTEPGTQVSWHVGRPRAWRRILAYLRAVTGL